MSDQPTLLIIAAGMGSRYGGLKQIDPVGPNGEVIIDYSMHDAIQAGFKKIVFVIRHYFEDAFREKIGSKLDGHVETAYAYQELDSCLNGFTLSEGREKPWGTGHAILVAKDVIQEPFAVINADDFYGAEAYRIMAKQLQQMANGDNNEYAMVGYILRNTLSDYGTVARGVCQHCPDMYMSTVTERTSIRKKGDGAAFMDDRHQEQPLTGDEIVSMNLWGFTPDIFQHLQQQFFEYLQGHGNENKGEFYIPSVVDKLVQEGEKKVKILKTHESWFGVTYPQDKEIAQSCIRKLIEQGIYPERLW
ncbi:MAG: nucleotidyltransferase family protein [Planctomycetota bacterium]|jgi:UTP-glucose-1-phosphate uridylyltransferase